MGSFDIQRFDEHGDPEPSHVAFSHFMTPSPPPNGGEGRGEGARFMGRRDGRQGFLTRGPIPDGLARVKPMSLHGLHPAIPKTALPVKTRFPTWTWAVLGLFVSLVCAGRAANISGHLRDPNWFARRSTSSPYGVGYYEYAVNANARLSSALGGAAATDVFGAFSMSGRPDGGHTLASWDVWWRSAYVFDYPVSGTGTPDIDLRLRALMWGYAAFWDDAGYHEMGQTFVASGPVAMIYLRAPFSTSYTLSVHTHGPGGAQVGVARSFGGGDQRLIYGFGDMPTVDGGAYYVRIRTGSPSIGGVISQMDPRPDFSDPMPEGCLWVGNAAGVSPRPDRDLGLTIMCDDDGLITDLFARSSGGVTFSGTDVGQSFIARGSSLVSAAFWLADPSAPTYVVQVRENGPGGPVVGTAKRGRPARLSADPEMIVTWSPGECPLVPGRTYYVEVLRDGGGTFSQVYVNTGNPFRHGQAFQNGIAFSGYDLAGTLMEEESAGSAKRPWVRLTTDPQVAESDRGTNQLTIRWATDVASDSTVEFAVDQPPYTHRVTETNLVWEHALTLTGLKSHALHHFRVRSASAGFRPAVSRDMVLCTRPAAPNLLANPSFELGSGTSPRRTVPGWSKSGSLDLAASDTTWFWGLPAHQGDWLLEGAVNGSTSDAYVYQRVAVTAGRDYTFSAWVTTWMRENNTWKYDVWQDRGRLMTMRLGIDPTGGTSPTAASVQWTPRFYSHLRYANVAKRAVAQGGFITVFVHMKGQGGEWHLYGVDDCMLTETAAEPAQLGLPSRQPDGAVRFEVSGAVGRTNRVEFTENFLHWDPLTNLFQSSAPLPVVDPSAVLAPRRFYRVVTP